MKIEDLDEFQGLTPHMVREWLGRHGWVQTKPQWWEKGEDGFVFDACVFEQQWFWLYALAAVHCTNIQGMLRKINPRMRKGWPSDEALSAHPFWLLNNAPIQCLPGVFTSRFVREKKQRSDPDFADIAPHYAWPCDERGNKVRWPERDGVML